MQPRCNIFRYTYSQHTCIRYKCQKTGPQSNNIYTVILFNKMQNTLNTLQRDTDITWFTQTMSYVHTEIANPFIIVQKDEGIQPAAIPLHFLFTLSHNQRDCLQCYNTIQYHTQSYYNAFLLQGKYHGKNTMVNPIPWVRKTFGQQTSQKNFPRTPRWGNECTVNLGYKHN